MGSDGYAFRARYRLCAGRAIKSKLGCRVVGVEKNAEAARRARERLDQVLELDIDDIDRLQHLDSPPFDCIILADVLEHLKDPWSALARLAPHLSSGGKFVISLPNEHLFLDYPIYPEPRYGYGKPAHAILEKRFQEEATHYAQTARTLLRTAESFRAIPLLPPSSEDTSEPYWQNSVF